MIQDQDKNDRMDQEEEKFLRQTKKDDSEPNFWRLIDSDLDDLEQKRYLKIAMPKRQKGGWNKEIDFKIFTTINLAD